MANVQDFKDENNLWVRRFTDANKERSFTVSGMLYHGLIQRTNPNGTKQKQSPLYKDCFSTFKNFQDFSNWCHNQIGYDCGFQLDKDLLVRNNKEYGKNTCVFLPQEINKLLTKRDRFRGEFPIGVSKDKNGIRARCNCDEQPPKFLGYYTSPLLAFNAYKTFKETFIKQQALKWKDQIDPRAFDALMAYEVLITD